MVDSLSESEGGYALSYRRGWHHPEFKNLRDAAIFQYLCIHAAWHDHEINFEGRRVALKRGQLVTSERFLAKGFVVDRKVIRRLFTQLEEAGMITRTWVKSANLARDGHATAPEEAQVEDHLKARAGTIITICNYDIYQKNIGQKGPAIGLVRDPARAQLGPSSGPNNKEENTLKEEKKDSIGAKAPIVHEGDDDLEFTVDARENTAREIACKFQKIWIDEFIGTAVSAPRKLTDDRIKACSLRFFDEFNKSFEAWRDYCRAIRSRPFCVGENDRGWVADFDWALKPKTILKIAEGKYTGKPHGLNGQKLSPIDTFHVAGDIAVEIREQQRQARRQREEGSLGDADEPLLDGI